MGPSVSYRYTAFLLGLTSNVPIPDLQPAAPSSAVDIAISLGSLPPSFRDVDTSKLELSHASEATDESGRPRRRIWRLPGSRYYLVDYCDGHRFAFDDAATEVWGEWPATSSLADNLTYLLGPIFGILLTMRRITCLHASCVQLGEGCVAVLGEAEAGKSTLAAAFALAGKTVLSDDITALERRDGQVVARPALPRIRLWPESAGVLGIPLERLPLLTPSWEKRYLDLRALGRFASAALPLQAVYVLAERNDEARRPYVEAMSARDGLIELLANAFLTRLPDERRSERDFPILSEVAARVPVLRVHPRTDPGSLPALCELIQQDLVTRVGVTGERAAFV